MFPFFWLSWAKGFGFRELLYSNLRFHQGLLTTNPAATPGTTCTGVSLTC